jgi:uncharacterized integral membrane protein (TIGR00698 family)
MRQFLTTNGKGVLLATVIGLSVHFFAPFVSGINGIMLGLLVGIVIGNFIKLPETFTPGISLTGSKLLEISILFLAFSINFGHISDLGWKNFLLVVVVIIGVLLTTIFLAKKMKCPDSTGWLVGFGTAICGSSAIAAVAPGISKNKQDAGIAVAVVNLMGSIGMIILPFVLKFLSVADMDSGVIIGATLHSVGNVAGAGYGINEMVGDTAITIKLARVAMLSPAVIFFTYLLSSGTKKNWKDYINLPFYLWAFVAITIITSLFDLPASLLSFFSTMGKVALTIAMVAIGLKVSFKQLYHSGKRALSFGVIIFMLQILFVVAFLLVANKF